MRPVWDQVAEKLVAVIPGLTPATIDLLVFSGQPISGDDPSHFVTVGYVADDSGGTFAQQRNDNGFAMDETGDVRCQFVSQTGDTLVAGVAREVFDIVGSLQTYINGNQTLDGVLSQDGYCSMSSEIRSELDEQGSAQSLVLTFRYWTSTY